MKHVLGANKVKEYLIQVMNIFYQAAQYENLTEEEYLTFLDKVIKEAKGRRDATIQDRRF